MVGFKPPYGRVPVDPPFNLDTYCHCGPLARTVADCALFENVLAGPDPGDIVSLRPKLGAARAASTAIEGLRVALSLDLGDWPVDAEVRREHARPSATALRAAGAIVEEVDLRRAARAMCSAPRRSTSRIGFARLGRDARPPSTPTR